MLFLAFAPLDALDRRQELNINSQQKQHFKRNIIITTESGKKHEADKVLVTVSIGTWTIAALEKKSTLKTLNLPLDIKVYFTGEIYDPYQQMGVPGAILSGYYAADKLLSFQ